VLAKAFGIILYFVAPNGQIMIIKIDIEASMNKIKKNVRQKL